MVFEQENAQVASHRVGTSPHGRIEVLSIAYGWLGTERLGEETDSRDEACSVSLKGDCRCGILSFSLLRIWLRNAGSCRRLALMNQLLILKPTTGPRLAFEEMKW